MKKQNRSAILLMALLLLIAVTASFVASTYAKYTSEINKTGTATVAAWNFATDNSTQTISMAIAETVNASTLVADRIAPGTSGSFDVVLKNTSEVGADFVVGLDEITNKPTNLKFYRTRTGSAGSYTYSNEIIPGTTEITGKLKAQDSTGVTVPIYWQWAYETGTTPYTAGDNADTTNGEASAANRALTIGVTIKGTQVNPTDAAFNTIVNQ